MTYIEWRDELASYLVGISDAERKKIFDYYAEMYADKRDAGMEEKQIIIEFGAPYDVAKRILDDPAVNGGTGALHADASQDASDDAAPGSDAAAPAAAAKPNKVSNIYGNFIKVLLMIASICVLIMVQIAVVGTAVTYVIEGSLSFVYGETGNGLSFMGLGLVFIGVSVIIIYLLTGVEKKIIRAVKTALHGGENV